MHLAAAQDEVEEVEPATTTPPAPFLPGRQQAGATCFIKNGTFLFAQAIAKQLTMEELDTSVAPQDLKFFERVVAMMGRRWLLTSSLQIWQNNQS